MRRVCLARRRPTETRGVLLSVAASQNFEPRRAKNRNTARACVHAQPHQRTKSARKQRSTSTRSSLPTSLRAPLLASSRLCVLPCPSASLESKSSSADVPLQQCSFGAAAAPPVQPRLLRRRCRSSNVPTAFSLSLLLLQNASSSPAILALVSSGPLPLPLLLLAVPVFARPLPPFLPHPSA